MTNELKAIREHKDKASLVDIYKNAFKARFGASPLIDITTANDVFGWAMENLGYDKSKLLLHAYLDMQDEWIESQAFPLEVFRKQINKVIVHCAKIEKRKESVIGRKLRISIETSCKNVHCPTRMHVDCYPDEVEDATYGSYCSEKCESDTVLSS